MRCRVLAPAARGSHGLELAVLPGTVGYEYRIEGRKRDRRVRWLHSHTVLGQAENSVLLVETVQRSTARPRNTFIAGCRLIRAEIWTSHTL